MSVDEMQSAALAGDPAAQFVDELGARFEAVHRAPCHDCGSRWQPECLGDLWGVVLEHEDTCPRVSR